MEIISPCIFFGDLWKTQPLCAVVQLTCRQQKGQCRGMGRGGPLPTERIYQRSVKTSPVSVICSRLVTNGLQCHVGLCLLSGKGRLGVIWVRGMSPGGRGQDHTIWTTARAWSSTNGTEAIADLPLRGSTIQLANISLSKYNHLKQSSVKICSGMSWH